MNLGAGPGGKGKPDEFPSHELTAFTPSTTSKGIATQRRAWGKSMSKDGTWGPGGQRTGRLN
ncbi:hypothetical protein B0H17DRAFT_1083850 [Mycena rosella]|uniref:Uncharacterized protein n=1 Tax=Mycena rosella TaxID=1033263 RepID=A0AAD7G9C9_MYCRO|nr:hypothetical protein B0H17DRAFT_1083850 [Mycena rosella]